MEGALGAVPLHLIVGWGAQRGGLANQYVPHTLLDSDSIRSPSTALIIIIIYRYRDRDRGGESAGCTTTTMTSFGAAQPSAVPAGLEVTAGASFCQIDANGCATDGAGEHGNDEVCTVQVNAAGYLTATEFETEPGYDYVTISGTRYSNRAGPSGVAAAADSTFTWRSDHSNTNAGWTICFGEMSSCDSINTGLRPLVLSLGDATYLAVGAGRGTLVCPHADVPYVRFHALTSTSCERWISILPRHHCTCPRHIHGRQLESELRYTWANNDLL